MEQLQIALKLKIIFFYDSQIIFQVAFSPLAEDSISKQNY